jgi:hypothetical protein
VKENHASLTQRVEAESTLKSADDDAGTQPASEGLAFQLAALAARALTNLSAKPVKLGASREGTQKIKL